MIAWITVVINVRFDAGTRALSLRRQQVAPEVQADLPEARVAHVASYGLASAGSK